MKKKTRKYLTVICTLPLLFINGCNSSGSGSDSPTPTPTPTPTPIEAIATDCDCGSIDQASPCIGSSISTQVNASPINGLSSIDSIFNWSFNSNGKDAKCGQFANGDYWIAPATDESTVTITAITGSDTVSVDANPVLESVGLLDGSNNYGNYDGTENIIPSLPISYSTMTSLLAAIQRDEAATGLCGTGAIIGECVDSYQVVTILASVPVNAGSTLLRPNITGESKVMLSLEDFDFSRIPSKTYLTGTDAAGYEAIRQRWSHSTDIFSMLDAATTRFSEGGRAFRSHILVDDYGSGTAVQFNNDLMTIFSDANTLPEKQAALAAMLSYGLDLYHGYFNAPATRYWGGVGGHYPGKYIPVALIASLLNDTTYADAMKAEAANIDTVYDDLGPQELAQFHASAGRSPIYGHYKSTSPIAATDTYWRDIFWAQCFDGAGGTCDLGVGSKSQLDPHGYIDGPATKPGDGYMPLNLGVARGMFGIMNIMPEVCNTINYPMLRSYIMGLHDNGLDTINDPCATPDSREDLATCNPKDRNCVYYGVTWGPVDPDVEFSDCITAINATTQIGRFRDLHGDPVTPAYTSIQVKDNWDTIIAEGNCGL